MLDVTALRGLKRGYTGIKPQFGDGLVIRLKRGGDEQAYLDRRDAFIKQTSLVPASGATSKGQANEFNHVIRIDYDTKRYAMASAALTGEDNKAFHHWLRAHADQAPEGISGATHRFIPKHIGGKSYDRYAFTYNDMLNFMKNHMTNDTDWAKFESGDEVTSDLGTTYKIVELA